MTNKSELQDQQPEVRRIFDEQSETWFFVVVDINEALTEPNRARKYWSDLKRREPQLSEICGQFKFVAPNGRKYNYDCVDQEGALRLIQSIPSKKAEPFKMWLAEVGRQRLEDYQDPTQVLERFKQHFRNLGRDEEWINARLNNIVARNDLTDEWQERGVKMGLEYAILTNLIHSGAFDIDIKEHKAIKKLKKENLRDHMTIIEIALSTLAEATSAEITRAKDAQGFEQNKDAAQKGGAIAGDARKRIEAETGKPVVSSKNFLQEKKKDKLEGDKE